MRRLSLIVLSLTALVGCDKKTDAAAPAPKAEGSADAPAAPQPAAAPAPAAAAAAPSNGSGQTGPSVETKDILAREPRTEESFARHILISWKDKAAIYARRPGGQQDPRGAARDLAAANAAVTATLERIKKGEDFKALMAELSEDPGSSKSGEPYPVDAGAPFVPGFKNLALRLDVNEVGVVETPFGYHIIQRVAPPPDPAESADILARKPVTEKSVVQHILISWKDKAQVYAMRGGQDPRGAARSLEDARKLAGDLTAAAKGGKDFAAMMKETSEDPGSAASGTPYAITKDAPFMPAFVKLGLRLNVGEVGVVATDYGFHIMKRTE